MGRPSLKRRKGIVGIEAAIVLIAFVIIAAAFAFMVINMGLFSTQRSKDTISQGLREASSPLQVDGSIFVRTTSDLDVNASIIPLRAMGVKYVPVGRNETVVSLSVVHRGGSSISYSNIYYGVVDSSYDPTGKSFDELVQAAVTHLQRVNNEGTLSFTLENITKTEELNITIDEREYKYSLSSVTGATKWDRMEITIQASQTPASFKAILYCNESEVKSSSTTTGSATIILTPQEWKNGTYTLLITEVSVEGEYTVKIAVYADAGEVLPIDESGTQLQSSYSTPKTVQPSALFPAAVLIIENSDGDEALDSSEKGFLVLLLGSNYVAEPRSLVTIEIRVERSAPLTVEYMVPESLTANSWMLVSG